MGKHQGIQENRGKIKQISNTRETLIILLFNIPSSLSTKDIGNLTNREHSFLVSFP